MNPYSSLSNFEQRIREIEQKPDAVRDKDLANILAEIERIENHPDLTEEQRELIAEYRREIEAIRQQTRTDATQMQDEMSEFQREATDHINTLLASRQVEGFKQALHLVADLAVMQVSADSLPWLDEGEIELFKTQLPAVRGMVGAIFVDTLLQNGYEVSFNKQGNLELQGGDKEVLADIHTVLQEFVQNNSAIHEIARAGLLYHSGDLLQYRQAVEQTDGTISDYNKNSEQFAEYLKNRHKNGQKTIASEILMKNPDILRFMDFEAYLDASKHVPAIVQGMPTAEQRDRTQEAIEVFLMRERQNHSSSSAHNGAYSASNTSGTSSSAGAHSTWLSEQISKHVSGAFSGFGQLVSDIVGMGWRNVWATMGLFGVVLYGIWKMFHLGPEGKFSFLRGMGAMLGLGTLNNKEGLGGVLWEAFFGDKKWDEKPQESTISNSPQESTTSDIPPPASSQAATVAQAQETAQKAVDLPPPTNIDTLRKQLWPDKAGESGFFEKLTEMVSLTKNMNAHQLYVLHGEKNVDKRKKIIDTLYGQIGYTNLSDVQKKQVDTIMSNATFFEYITKLIHHPSIQVLREKDHAAFSALSIDGMEQYIITHPIPASQEDAPKEGSDALLLTETSITIRDGKYYLIGPNGPKEFTSYDKMWVNPEITKEHSENLKKSISVLEHFSLIIEAYFAKNPNADKQKRVIEGLTQAFQTDDIMLGKSVFRIDDDFLTKFNTYVQAGFPGIPTIRRIFKIVDEDARYVEVLQFIRSNLWQYDLVADQIIENHESYFNFPSNADLVARKISMPDWDEKKNGYVRNEILDAQKKANADWEKNFDAYMAQFRSQYPGNTKSDAEIKNAAYEKLVEMHSVIAGRRAIAYQTIYNNKWLKPELALLQDILGAGTWDMSDRAIDFSKEIMGILAIEAIAIAAGAATAGAGAFALNAAIAAWYAKRGKTLYDIYNNASRIKRIGVGTAQTVIQGTLFHVGYGWARGMIDGNFDALLSGKWYVQSIAMFGVMRGLSAWYNKPGTVLNIEKGAGALKKGVKFIGQVTVDAAAITGITGLTGQYIFEEDHTAWSLEQLGQAIILSLLLRGSSAAYTRFRVSKDANGNPVVTGIKEPSARKPHDPTVTLNADKTKLQQTQDEIKDLQQKIATNKKSLKKRGNQLSSKEIENMQDDILKWTQEIAQLQAPAQQLSAKIATREARIGAIDARNQIQIQRTQDYINTQLNILQKEGGRMTIGGVEIKWLNGKYHFRRPGETHFNFAHNRQELYAKVKFDSTKIAEEIVSSGMLSRLGSIATKKSATVNGHQVEVLSDGSLRIYTNKAKTQYKSNDEAIQWLNKGDNAIQVLQKLQVYKNMPSWEIGKIRSGLQQLTEWFEQQAMHKEMVSLKTIYREFMRFPANTVAFINAFANSPWWKQSANDVAKIILLGNRASSWTAWESYKRPGILVWVPIAGQTLREWADADPDLEKTIRYSVMFQLLGSIWGIGVTALIAQNN